MLGLSCCSRSGHDNVLTHLWNHIDSNFSFSLHFRNLKCWFFFFFKMFELCSGYTKLSFTPCEILCNSIQGFVKNCHIKRDYYWTGIFVYFFPCVCRWLFFVIMLLIHNLPSLLGHYQRTVRFQRMLQYSFAFFFFFEGHMTEKDNAAVFNMTLFKVRTAV